MIGLPRETLSPHDRSYPARLRGVYEPPDLRLAGPFRDFDRPCVAVVGARAATVRACRLAEEVACEVAGAGIVIASGMARGIDRAAHEGALAAAGVTVAVLGTGLDVIYPREHAGLRDRIAKTGALVTELPDGSPPLAYHFPRRNRILAALADVIVVVEAEAKSGALVTARWGLEMGREVMAVPKSPWDPGSEGVNALIRDGASPVVDARDVLVALSRVRGVDFTVRAASSGGGPGGAGEDDLVAQLRARGPLDPQALAEALGIDDASVLMRRLGRLELGGVIRRGPQGFEVRDAPVATPAG